MPENSKPQNKRLTQSGLTASEVAERVAAGRVNRRPAAGWTAYRALVIRNTATLFNALVAPAAAALFWLEDYRGAFAVSAMAVCNSLIGLIQEVRAIHRLERLSVLAESNARVRREGQETAIPASDVVIDDLILLAAGDVVVADGTVVSADSLEIDEALLTGESDAVAKVAGDRLLSGSHCVAGAGVCKVDRVGRDAFVQQTSTEAQRYRFIQSPMQRTLDSLVRALTATAVLLCVFYLGIYWHRRFPPADLWQMIAATVTAMVPQGLLLMTTMAFSLAAIRMSRRGAIVQLLNSVESMASITVLCMDKTGTLTTGQLSVDQIIALGANADQVRQKLRHFACLSADGNNKSLLALRTVLESPPSESTPELIDQLPFKSQNRYSMVRLRFDRQEHTLVLGAFEALFPSFSGHAAVALETKWSALMPSGLRLLVFAEARSEETAKTLTTPLAEWRLEPLALVAFEDEIRQKVGAILKSLEKQGIEIKLISGDHPETVNATIQQLHLNFRNKAVMQGEEFATADDRQQIARDFSIFGRVAPRQKLEIVAALQAQGFRVCMIGDGVNDILPIKRADLGIAMGAGSSATKKVAGLVLANNDFEMLPAILEEGRTLLDNLRQAAKLFLLKNVYTLFLIVAALGVFRLDFPYLPQQVTLLNFLTIGVPSLLIVANRTSSQHKTQAAFLREVGTFAVACGLATGVAALVAWMLSARHFEDDLEIQRTVLLSTLILAGMGNVVIVSKGNRWLVGWAVFGLALYAAVYCFPLTAYYFALVNLSAARWSVAAISAACAIMVCFAIGKWQDA